MLNLSDDTESVSLTTQARWVLFNISATSSIVICILYWIGQASDLINKQTVLFSVTIHVHLICCFMSIIEIFVTKIPIRTLHFYQPVFFFVYVHYCYIDNKSIVSTSLQSLRLGKRFKYIINLFFMRNIFSCTFYSLWFCLSVI